MEHLFAISIIISITLSVVLWSTIHRQTMRADRAEAALNRVEAEINRGLTINRSVSHD